jgi:methylglyoxal synthase
MNIAIIADDNKKKLMENLCVAYRHILNKNELYATETTGRLVEEVSGLTVHKYLAGKLGGEQQIGAQIVHNDIDLVIFLKDPSAPMKSDGEITSVSRLCDSHNIPLATNLATAEVLLMALDRGELEWINVSK